MNDNIKMTNESSAKVSPLLNDFPSEEVLAPLHLIVPELDTPEFFRQTKEYHAKVLDAKQECHIHLARKRDHLDVIENLINDNDDVLNYMLENMKD
ncbi:hypothetical protein AB4186_07340 [Vibrio lentus]|uniref:hypothetical protein n=1 Tax=Vibrio lentus TaxID=136468 RepID=UPI0035508ABF